MSAANVRFYTLDHKPCPEGQKPERFGFRCVKFNRNRHPRLEEVECGKLLIAGATSIKRDGQGANGGSPQWDWDGDRDSPTFKPSINCEGHCGWHGFIEKGRCVDVNKKDEP